MGMRLTPFETEAPDEVDPESFDWSYVRFENGTEMVSKAYTHGQESVWLEQLQMDGTITEDN